MGIYFSIPIHTFAVVLATLVLLPLYKWIQKYKKQQVPSKSKLNPTEDFEDGEEERGIMVRIRVELYEPFLDVEWIEDMMRR